MEQLFQKSRKKVANVSLDFIRGIFDEINWDARLIGIKGARGIGKTTLLLQHIKKNVGLSDEALYVSLDDIWFSDNKLIDLADEFVKKGGVFLYLDEVHKYPNWSREIKNIYDDHLELKVVFTGSSLLEILNARADLSRRAIVYAMQGLSFREYLNYSLNEQFHPYSLKEICTTHSEISAEIVQRIRPLKYFDLYLKTGYYPFFKDIPELYYYRIEEIVDMILQVELPLQRGVEIK
ncbi:MAG: ATP-binding protein, partial [Bacteroidota bacterium]